MVLVRYTLAAGVAVILISRVSVFSVSLGDCICHHTVLTVRLSADWSITASVGATEPRGDAGSDKSVSDMGACDVVGGAESAHAIELCCKNILW